MQEFPDFPEPTEEEINRAITEIRSLTKMVTGKELSEDEARRMVESARDTIKSAIAQRQAAQTPGA